MVLDAPNWDAWLCCRIDHICVHVQPLILPVKPKGHAIKHTQIVEGVCASKHTVHTTCSLYAPTRSYQLLLYADPTSTKSQKLRSSRSTDLHSIYCSAATRAMGEP